MTQRNWFSRCLQLGCIGILGWLGVSVFASKTFAQSTPSNIVPDNTLGRDSSVVTPNFQGLPIEAITGGATRGANLFHSFQEFNVSTGRVAYFFNLNASIQNILARVTGRNRSEILGTLGIFGNSAPNLFLINPNGIIFGPNASLDVNGSFVATTANAIKLGDNGLFSATEPATSNLLTVSPSALFFNVLASQGIVNPSIATSTVPGSSTTLQVPDGQSLLLVGGNVKLEGGILVARGGRVELGGLASGGTVGLGANGNVFSLNFPEGVRRADVSLSNNAVVNVISSGGGSIAINAQNLDISGKSSLLAGIASGRGTVDSQAGDITLNSTEQIKAEQESVIGNLVLPGATGNSGNIRITTGSLFVTNGAQLNTSTSGQGSAGNVIIDARDNVFFNGGQALSSVTENSIGNGGDISIKTGNLSVGNGAILSTITFGTGSAGSVKIDARDNVFFSEGTAVTSAGKNSIGNSGDIRITTGSLSVTNGAEFTTSNFGRGSSGNLIINARENVLFDASIPLTSVGVNVIGNSGDIRITTGSLFVTNGAQLTTSMFGKGSAGNVIIDARDNVLFDRGNASTTVGDNAIGNGGDIRITTGSLSVTNGAILVTASLGQARAGNLIINARENVSFDDGNAITNVIGNGVGNSGDIFVTTRTLRVTNGSTVASGIGGQGNAGNIQINAKDSVTVSGSNPKSGFSSALFTDTGSAGKGGNITVDTNVFRVIDGGVLDARTFSNGNGGNITVNANLFEALNGGQLITTTTSGSGRAGKITVNATDKVIVDGVDAIFDDRLSKFGAIVANPNAASGFFVFSNSSGTTGDISVTSPKITLDNGGRFIASSASGNGGNINLNVSDLLLLRRGTQISTNAGTEQKGGDGGNIDINSKFIVAIPQENSDITANAYTGSGGNVQITSQGIFGIESRSKPTEKSDITASSELGVAGVTNINSPETNIQNSLTPLPENIIDTSSLIANSCIARRNNRQSSSTFYIIGNGALPERPGDAPLSPFPTGTMRSVLNEGESAQSSTATTPRRSWKVGDPIVEAQGVYRLANGELVLSRECL